MPNTQNVSKIYPNFSLVYQIYKLRINYGWQYVLPKVDIQYLIRNFYPATSIIHKCQWWLWWIRLHWLCDVADLFYFFFFLVSINEINSYCNFYLSQNFCPVSQLLQPPSLRPHITKHLRVSTRSSVFPSNNSTSSTLITPPTTYISLVFLNPTHSTIMCYTVSSTPPHNKQFTASLENRILFLRFRVVVQRWTNHIPIHTIFTYTSLNSRYLRRCHTVWIIPSPIRLSSIQQLVQL